MNTPEDTPIPSQPKFASHVWWKTVAGCVLIILIVVALTPWLVGPPCPKHVVIATGSDAGAYFAFAKRYQSILESKGITLEIRTTAGSVENAELLRDANSGVSVAIMQGGTAKTNANGQNTGSPLSKDLSDTGIQSLASLFLEPIWVFYRKETPLKRLADLKGKRVAIGAKGSGTRAVALELLADNGFLAQSSANPTLHVIGEADAPKTTLVSQNSRKAVDGLKAGQIDAAFFVMAPTAPLIVELMEDESIQLLNFERAVAYTRRHPYLSSVTIAEGMLDLKRNRPAKDIELLAPTAVLVARQDLHPALVPLFLQAASEIHEGGGVLEVPRAFPSEEHVEFPINKDARSFLRSGPSFLYRNLPFSIAAWVDRMKLMLLPLLTLLIPLFKAAPPLYRWRIRSKIYTWYGALREVDQARKESSELEVLAPHIDRLKEVEKELAEISVPLSFMEEFYNLRWHVAFVLEQLESQQQHTLSTMSVRSENSDQTNIPHIPKSPVKVSESSHSA